jgi:toxin ParE1/3/4
MGYKLTRRAEQDLIDIYIEGFRQFGEAQAEAYAQKLVETFELLAKFPRLARERVGYRRPCVFIPVDPMSSSIWRLSWGMS